MLPAAVIGSIFVHWDQVFWAPDVRLRSVHYFDIARDEIPNESALCHQKVRFFGSSRHSTCSLESV